MSTSAIAASISFELDLPNISADTRPRLEAFDPIVHPLVEFSLRPDFDPTTADVPDATLLGERQLRFLEDWAADWEATDMKAVLSQTVFANATSLHGRDQTRLIADYDSNGWPQTGRNKAIAMPPSANH